MQNARSKEEFFDQIEDLIDKLEDSKAAKESVENSNKELIEEVEYLQINNRRLKRVTTRLNNEMTDTRSRLKILNKRETKDFKMQIKHWKKRLEENCSA